MAELRRRPRDGIGGPEAQGISRTAVAIVTPRSSPALAAAKSAGETRSARLDCRTTRADAGHEHPRVDCGDLRQRQRGALQPGHEVESYL